VLFNTIQGIKTLLSKYCKNVT